MWQKAVAALALGLLLAGPVAGCARPQQRPEAQESPAELSASVARVAAQESGAGETAAVVFDNHALIAMQLNLAEPGGTRGEGLGGTVTQPTARDLTDPGKGPPNGGTGPGGSVGIDPASPGGAVNPGGSTPGGSPVHTQAVPNASGGPATDAGTNAPVASPGAMGSTPLDVMHRIANQVTSRFPTIDEVRFAYQPENARRVQAIAREIQAGAAVEAFHAELSQLYDQAAPAGVTEFHPMHPAPANNPQGGPGPNPEPARP